MGFRAPLASAPGALKSAIINTAASGSVELVAPVQGQTIYVYSFVFQAASVTNVTFQSETSAGATGTLTALTGPFPEAANTGVSANGGGSPVFIVPVGLGLAINNSAAVQLSGVLSYAQF